MQPILLSRSQSQQIDKIAIEKYGISSLVLMENAGRGVVDKLIEWGLVEPVVVCCGKGNNAGDGFVIARHLEIRSAAVRLLLFASPEDLSGDARTNYELLTKTDVPIRVVADDVDEQQLDELLAGSGWIVDALLGTGARGRPRPPYDRVIDAMNRADARKLAVDLPSGLDCDTGQANSPTFQAQQTCTFVAAKRGFYKAQGPDYCGEIHVLDIGAPKKILREVI